MLDHMVEKKRTKGKTAQVVLCCVVEVMARHVCVPLLITLVASFVFLDGATELLWAVGVPLPWLGM
eukprot:84802-Pelagomonas_calceolata.AAC.3